MENDDFDSVQELLNFKEKMEMLEKLNEKIEKLNTSLNDVIVNLDNLDSLENLTDSNGKSYLKTPTDNILDMDGNTYIKSTDDNDYTVELIDKNGVITKYIIYKKTE